MAELLLHLKDNVHPDPQKDLRGSYKRGFIVRVEEDGFAWSRKESIEQWVAEGNDPDDWHGITAIIKIPGVSKADVQYVTESLYDVIGEDSVTVRRRGWRARLDQLPRPIMNQIDRDYVYTATAAQWNAVIEYLGV